MTDENYVKLYLEDGLWCADVHWSDGTVNRKQWKDYKDRDTLKEEVLLVTNIVNIEVWE